MDALGWLEAEVARLTARQDGRNTAIYRLAIQAAQRATTADLESTLRERLLAAVHDLYQQDARLSSRIASLKNGWAVGLATPTTTPDIWDPTPARPITHTAPTAHDAFLLSRSILQDAVATEGTTLLCSPTGAMKTGAMIDVLTRWAVAHQEISREAASDQEVMFDRDEADVERYSERPRVLIALPSNDTAAETYQRLQDSLRSAGVPRYRAYHRQGRNQHTCERIDTYLAHERLMPGKGSAFCQSCPLRSSENGAEPQCRPPRPPHSRAWFVVCTHAMAPHVAKHWKPSVVIQDEQRGAIAHTFTAAQIQTAVQRGEIQAHGMTAPGATLFAHGQKASGEAKPLHASKQAAEAVGTNTAGTTPQLFADRQEAGGDTTDALSLLMDAMKRSEEKEPIDYESVCQWVGCITAGVSEEREQIEPSEAEHHPHHLALSALNRSNGSGAYIYKGTLHILTEPEHVEASRRVILDATATPKITERLHGAHRWIRIDVPLSEHVEHIHIPVDAGKSARSVEGFKTAKLDRVYQALRARLPDDTLWVGSKGWDLEYGPEIHFDGTEARGSNEYRDCPAVVAADRRVPRVVLEAYADFYSVGSPDEEWTREVVFQLEQAPIIQALGRIRPLQASPINPKLMITLGSSARVRLSERSRCLPVKMALFQLTGEHSGSPPAELWELARKGSGVWSSDGVVRIPESLAISADPRFSKSPILTSVGCDTLELRPGTGDPWHRALRKHLLTVRFSTGRKGGATVATFLAPREASPEQVKALIRQRAESSGWLRWSVPEMGWTGSILERLHSPTFEDLLFDLAISPKVAHRLIEAFGGWEAYQEHHRGTAMPEPAIEEPRPARTFAEPIRVLSVQHYGSDTGDPQPLANLQEAGTLPDVASVRGATPQPLANLPKAVSLPDVASVRADFDRVARSIHHQMQRDRAVIEKVARSIQRQTQRWLANVPIPLEEPLPPSELTLERIHAILEDHHDLILLWHCGELLPVPKRAFVATMRTWSTERQAALHLEFIRKRHHKMPGWWADPQRVRYHLNREARAQNYPRSTYTREIEPNLRSWLRWIKTASIIDARLCYLHLRMNAPSPPWGLF